MSIGLTIIGVSAGILIVLVSLFRVEESHNKRLMLSSLRSHFDSVVMWCSQKVMYFFGYIGSGVFRVTFHFILHKILNVVIATLAKAEGYLAHLQLRNKHIAKIVKNKNRGHESHLDMIALHKEEVSLSEEEKRKRRLH